MKKTVLLLFGVILVLIQNCIVEWAINTQYILFVTGVLLLGVPHGAADLLVATKNAALSGQSFSKQKFFLIYIGRLSLFAIILFYFPVVGNILFILFAAYHFGETDLCQFKTNTWLGKFFVISYGLLILSIILLHHFDDIIPIYQQFESSKKNLFLINWISKYRYYLLSANGITFFIAAFMYFLRNTNYKNNDSGQFLIHFAIILTVLFMLPMFIGFTFYFVIWHSFLSITNIVQYLRVNNEFSLSSIVKQILLYSSLAILGIFLFGLTSYMFINKNTIAGYLFLGLAVLTAPHMQIMYNMYILLRKDRSILHHV